METMNKSKAIFMSKVFLFLFVQLLVMYSSYIYSVDHADTMNAYKTSLNILFIGLFIGYLLVRFRYPNPRLKMMLLLTLPLLFGAMLTDVRQLDKVLVEVMVLFGMLCVIGYVSSMYNIDLNGVGLLLSLALFVMIIYRLMNRNETSTYAHIVGLIFALFVIVDTNNMLKREYHNNFMNASMDYFSDIFELIRWVDYDN